eukprot:gene6396-8807_t
MVNASTATFTNPLDFVYAACALGCVTCAALAAGMTIGMLSLDSLKLRIKLDVGTEQEKTAAKNILPLIENHHFLLCTLLLFNSVANEALPIFLDSLVPSWAAVIISVTAVLLFGEVIPTALFTGPSQLIIASRFTNLVYFLEIIFYPIAFPLSLVLDRVLGADEEGDTLNRNEISSMVKILKESRSGINGIGAASNHGNLSNDKKKGQEVNNPLTTTESADSNEESPLSDNEVKVITGVLALGKKTVRDIYVPLDQVNMLSSDQILDYETLDVIDRVGNSRLPVFSGTNTRHILGFLMVKRLIKVNPDQSLPLASIKLNSPLVVGANDSLLDVLTLFQQGGSHLALVSERPSQLQKHLKSASAPDSTCAPLGIVSIEDLFEEMIQAEIYDEDDVGMSNMDDSASIHLREMSLSARPSAANSLIQESPLMAMVANRNNNNSNGINNGTINNLDKLEAGLKNPHGNMPPLPPPSMSPPTGMNISKRPMARNTSRRSFTNLQRSRSEKLDHMFIRKSDPSKNNFDDNNSDDDDSYRSKPRRSSYGGHVLPEQSDQSRALSMSAVNSDKNKAMLLSAIRNVDNNDDDVGKMSNNNHNHNNNSRVTPSLITKYIRKRAVGEQQRRTIIVCPRLGICQIMPQNWDLKMWNHRTDKQVLKRLSRYIFQQVNSVMR